MKMHKDMDMQKQMQEMQQQMMAQGRMHAISHQVRSRQGEVQPPASTGHNHSNEGQTDEPTIQ